MRVMGGRAKEKRKEKKGRKKTEGESSLAIKLLLRQFSSISMQPESERTFLSEREGEKREREEGLVSCLSVIVFTLSQHSVPVLLPSLILVVYVDFALSASTQILLFLLPFRFPAHISSLELSTNTTALSCCFLSLSLPFHISCPSLSGLSLSPSHTQSLFPLRPTFSLLPATTLLFSSLSFSLL